MDKKAFIVSIIGAVVIIGGALAWRSQQETPNDTKQQTNRSISLSELTTADGKDGKDCWVAVDKVVYEIEQGFKWVDGDHTESSGQAYCGADLSNAIDRAPHGRTKLAQLKKVGVLD